MVERFNGRIAEVLQTHRFDSTQGLATTLLRYANLYNHHMPQRALNHQTPVQALKQWQASHPDLFHKKVYHITGLDIYIHRRIYNRPGLDRILCYMIVLYPNP